MEHPDSAKAKPLAQVQWSGRGGLEGSEILFVFEGQFNGFDFFVGAGGEIGDGTVFDFSVLSIGLAEQDAAIGLSRGEQSRTSFVVSKAGQLQSPPPVLEEAERSEGRRKDWRRGLDGRVFSSL